MHPNEIAALMSGDTLADKRWPPESEAERWGKVGDYRRRYENDAGALFSHRPELHVADDPEATAGRMATFTPVGLARDLSRFSAQLLFSEPPKLTVKGEAPEVGESVEQRALQDLADSNDLTAFLYDAADQVASEGAGGLRVIQDDDVNGGKPILTFESEDHILWNVRYGRFVSGGVVIVERKHEGATFRLLEEHGEGYVRRRLFKGSETRLGTPVGLTSSAGPLEFRDLKDEYRTGISRPTLTRWLNVPGGHSDIAGLEALLDELDEGESIGREKLRASKSLVFVNRRLADNKGVANIQGAILLGDGVSTPVEDPKDLVKVEQPSMQASDHIAYLDHIRELAVTMAGYSLASWGLDQGGSADSGKALKLRQSRTLLTRSGKERMAVGAISETCSVGLEMMTGSRVEVEVALADGMPRDTLELSQEVAEKRSAGVVSDKQAIRELHPEWTEKQIEDEAASLPTDDRSTISSLLNGGIS